jgi:hypothetical protein
VSPRLAKIGRLAKLSPRNALAHSGIGDALADELLDRVLAGQDAATIAEALQDRPVASGFRRPAPLTADEVDVTVRWVRHARRRMVTIDSEIDHRDDAHEQLRHLLTPPEVQPA